MDCEHPIVDLTAELVTGLEPLTAHWFKCLLCGIRACVVAEPITVP